LKKEQHSLPGNYRGDARGRHSVPQILFFMPHAASSSHRTSGGYMIENNEPIQHKKDPYKLLLIILIALLVIQLGVSAYSAITNTIDRQQTQARLAAQEEAKTQLLQALSDNFSATADMLNSYEDDVYNNLNVDSAPKQQIMQNEHIFIALLKTINQNNLMIEAILAGIGNPSIGKTQDQ
jgi:hypothetical protein